MFKKRLLNKFVVFLMCCVVVFCNVLIPTQSIAYDGIRDDPNGCNIPEDSAQTREKNPCYIVDFDNKTNRCEVGSLKFSAMLPLNRDIEWEFFPLPGNQYCAAFAIAHIVALYAAAKVGALACWSTGLSANIEAGNVIPGIGPQSLITQGLLGVNCSVAIGQCTSGIQCSTVAPCCGALALYASILTASVLELSIIFAIADSFFKETQICGWRWRGWEKETITSTEENSRGQKWEKSKGPYRKCIENIFTPGLHETSSRTGKVAALKTCGDPALGGLKKNTNKSWREYVYGGMEYEDNGSNACSNPVSWSTDEKNKLLGYETQNQRYYFSGSGEGSTPNFACYRFLQKTASDPTGSKARDSYDCCVNRSQETLCVEQRPVICLDLIGDNSCNNPKYKFCQADSKCDIEGVTFETFYGKKNTSYLCAQSYSVCPYNQTVAGGTEIAKYDESPLYSDVKLNFCQHLSHCWKLPLQPTVRSSEFSGNYIASACYDMKGDSQNIFDYNAGQLQISTRHFTAPFVQCFKETMENVFLNRAGHDVCSDSAYNSLPQCGGASNILYAQGSYLPADKSFFKKIQNKYRTALKMVLTISVMMLGISTLLAVPKLHLEKKVIMTFILKLSLVMYFALGDAWQLSFANAVLNISSIMSDITFRPNLYDGKYEKLDGCQFPRYNSESPSKDDYTKQSYPAGKEYLRIWDTLDCKIIKALGFGGEVSVPNILLIIIAGFFSSALGVIIFVATFVFGFILISIAIRAMHIFLISTSAIIILLFISPFTITMVMFERTKKVFESWWKYLLGYSLQPMILFIYISIFLSAMDSILIGSAEYKGQTVQISSDKRYVGMTARDSQSAIDNYGFITEKNVDCNIGNASWDSIICIFNLTKFGKLSGFDTIGIGIPTITNISKEKLETITKAALIMFIFLNFIDTMTLFASKLVGGSEIKSDWNVKTATMLKGAHNLIRGIQKRGMRAIVKHGASMARTGSQILKGGPELANRSKNIANSRDQAKNDSKDPVGPKGGDSVPGAVDDHAGRNDKAGGDSAKPSPSGDHQGSDSDSRRAGPSSDHQDIDSGSKAAPSGDHQARDSSGSGAAPIGDHSSRDSSGGNGEVGTRSDHVSRDNESGAGSGSATPISPSGSDSRGDAPRNDSSTSSGGSGDGAKDGVNKPDAGGDDGGASKNEDHAERSGDDSKISDDEKDKKNTPSGDFADRSDSPQPPSAQGSKASLEVKKPAALDDKNKDKSPDQGDKDDGGYDADKEDDESSSDDSAEGDDGGADDEGKAGGDAKGDDKSKSKQLKPRNGKVNTAAKAKERRMPKAGRGSAGRGSAGGGSAGGGSAGGGSAGGGSAGGGFSSPALGSNTGSDMKIGITDLSGGIKIGSDGDIIGGMLGEGLGIKSSGDALQSIIAQSSNTTDKTTDNSSSRSARRSSSPDGARRSNGRMTGDQAKALFNMLKNQSQGPVSVISQGAQSSGSQGQSSQFPSLSGQSIAKDVSLITPEARSSDGISSQISAPKPAFPSLPGVGQKSTSSSSSTSPLQNTQQLMGNKKISDEVKRVVDVRGAGASSSGASSSVGSSPLDHLGVLGDFMAKGIDPLSKGISGAVDNLFGIGSSKTQKLQTSSETSPSQGKLASPRNQTSQSDNLQSSPRSDVKEVLRARQDLTSKALNTKLESPQSRTSSPDSKSPKDLRNVKDAWGSLPVDSPATPPPQESKGGDDSVKTSPPRRNEKWATSQNKRNSKIKGDFDYVEDILEIEEIEEDPENEGEKK